ncbi:MAG: c-type cytochrome [Gammaproteobacteria bacterium]|nr:MAG: c-type cytochrome [Gammaproteobacteria bacterium]
MMCVAGLTSSLLSAGQVSPPVPAAPTAPAPAAPAPTAPAAPANGMIKYACSGCHGGNGGGGMCPPLTNDVWVYGGDDDTLFRLVAYGTEALQAKGYGRKGTENVVGPMPPMGQIVQTDDEVWRILAFVRSNYHGAPECKFGCGSD